MTTPFQDASTYPPTPEPPPEMPVHLTKRQHRNALDGDFFDSSYVNALVLSDPTKIAALLDSHLAVDEWWREQVLSARKTGNEMWLKRLAEIRLELDVSTNTNPYMVFCVDDESDSDDDDTENADPDTVPEITLALTTEEYMSVKSRSMGPLTVFQTFIRPVRQRVLSVVQQIVKIDNRWVSDIVTVVASATDEELATKVYTWLEDAMHGEDPFCLIGYHASIPPRIDEDKL